MHSLYRLFIIYKDCNGTPAEGINPDASHTVASAIVVVIVLLLVQDKLKIPVSHYVAV